MTAERTGDPGRRDPGFFGPASISWRIHRDSSAIPGAGRALLIQALNPHVMDVFLANTDYRDDPWGRLRRTGDYFRDVIYGDRDRALAAGRGVRLLHDRLEGVTDPESGRIYRAGDPDLLLWVHATAVDSFLASYRRYGGWISRADGDRYVKEQVVAAQLVGIDPADAPACEADLRDYLAGVTGLRLTKGADDGMRMILFDPPITPWLKPAWVGISAAVISLLPRPIRDLYRLPWARPLDAPVRLTGIAASRAYNAYMAYQRNRREITARA